MEIAQVYRPEYAPDGMGGRKREWHQRPSIMVSATFSRGREAETGRTSVERQSVTMTAPRYADVAEGDRAIIRGIEYTVDVIDPAVSGAAIKLYGQRVTGGGAG